MTGQVTKFNRNPVQKVHRAFRRQLPKFNEDGRRNYGFHDGASWVCPEKIVGRISPNLWTIDDNCSYKSYKFRAKRC